MQFLIEKATNRIYGYTSSNEEFENDEIIAVNEPDITEIDKLYYFYYDPIEKKVKKYPDEQLPQIELNYFNKQIFEKKKTLYYTVNNHILREYPKSKQESDAIDRETWSLWIIRNNSNETIDSIGKKVYNSAANILEGVSDYNIELSNYPNTLHTYGSDQLPESYAWGQLIKVAVRTGLANICKVIYKREIEKLDQIASLDFDALNSYVFPTLPEMPPLE
jgi:phage tail protein X